MELFSELRERGLVAQMTNEEETKRLLNEGNVTFYIGFDPTADSLHIGHFIQMKVMAHMQRAGHRPIAIFGGGTAMIGDPSGKSDMRKMMTKETITHNIECFKAQMAKFIDISEGKALFVNNADWLWNLNYIDFIRDIGSHFTVNRMLAAECYKSRMETGLTFLEFNYMIMQSYDFYRLFLDHGCLFQFGGDDQWSNIIGGVELIRRKTGKEAYGMTFNLLVNSDGKKMGKTEKGALWLDPEKTTPYEFYQYFRNVGDGDVIRCMKLITFMPLSEISDYERLSGQELNRAKERLAFEVTKMVHGETEAIKSQQTAVALFQAGGISNDMPTKQVPDFNDETSLLDLLVVAEIIPSKSEGRRLCQQNGLSINDEKITDPMAAIKKAAFKDGYIIVKKGKKSIFKVVLEG